MGVSNFFQSFFAFLHFCKPTELLPHLKKARPQTCRCPAAAWFLGNSECSAHASEQHSSSGSKSSQPSAMKRGLKPRRFKLHSTRTLSVCAVSCWRIGSFGSWWLEEALEVVMCRFKPAIGLIASLQDVSSFLFFFWIYFSRSCIRNRAQEQCSG